MKKRIVYGLIAALAILHQDWWWWDDPYLVFGFMPIGLAYHALYSLLAAGAWGLALHFCWPDHLERFAAGEDGEAPPAA